MLGGLTTSTDSFMPQYDVAANPTLLNPEFAGSKRSPDAMK